MLVNLSRPKTMPSGLNPWIKENSSIACFEVHNHVGTGWTYIPQDSYANECYAFVMHTSHMYTFDHNCNMIQKLSEAPRSVQCLSCINCAILAIFTHAVDISPLPK